MEEFLKSQLEGTQQFLVMSVLMNLVLCVVAGIALDHSNKKPKQ